MPNPFIEERLEIGFNYGASYGPRFKTAIATQSDGSEQRRSHWIDPLILVDLAEFPIDNDEIDYLLAFHASVKGSAIGFRIRDWSDYLCPGYTLGTGDGTEQTWQLIKTYTIGAYSVKRAILKPVAGSIVLRVDGGIAESGWFVDTTTGVITTNLTGGLSIDEFSFDVPVRFNQDKINFTFVGADQWGKKFFKLQPLTCTEIRIQPQIYPPLDPLPDLLPQIQLGYDYGTIGGPEFNTSVVYSGSEFESRKALRPTPLGDWNIGDRGLSRAETDYLIAFFRLARGMAVPFNFYDWQDETIKRVRFSEDVIRLRWDAYREGDRAIQFNLGGIGVKEIFVPQCQAKSRIFSDPLLSLWTVVSAPTTGVYAGASYELDISGGFWQSTLNYGNGGSGNTARIEWGKGWSYTPLFSNEIINLTFAADLRFVDGSGGYNSSFNYLLDLIATQRGTAITLRVSIDQESGWKTYSTSDQFDSFVVGVPIVFTLSRLTIGTGSPSFVTQAMKNISLEIDVTCS